MIYIQLRKSKYRLTFRAVFPHLESAWPESIYSSLGANVLHLVSKYLARANEKHQKKRRFGET
jgi:hypothetical protein